MDKVNIEETNILNRKIKVLHLDDEKLQLEILRINLELINNNIQIESETDCIKAIEKIEKNDYDCILLDYLMPIYDGLEVAKRIRQISNVPIVLYTIQDSDDIVEKLFNLGINDYIRKELGESNYLILEKKIINLVKNNRILKLFKKTLNNVTDYIVILDKNYKILCYNDKFKRKFDENVLMGKKIVDFVDDLQKDVFYNYLLNEEEYMDVILEDANNIKYNVEVHKSIINLNDEFVILNIKDITEQILKSTITDTSDDRFNAIANMSPDAIMTMNMWGYITYINNAFSDLTGFSKEEIIGKHMLKLPTMAGKNIGPYLDLLKSFFSGNLSTNSIEFPYNRKDGTSGIGDAYINLIKVNKKRELIAIIKDVTDIKKKEEEYQNIFKTSPEGIIHLDIDNKIKNINAACSDLLSINPSEYLGKSISDLNIELNKKINMKNIYSQLQNNNSIKPFEIELNIDNKLKSIEISIGLIKILEECLGTQVILRDITKQKIIERERIEYTEKLEKLVQERTNQIVDNEKMVTMAKVSSMIAHDLKGPLQVIQNSLYLMTAKPDNQEVYIDFIRNAVNQANDLIEEMRSKGKQTPLILEYFSLSKLIDESLIQVKVSDSVTFETIIKSEIQVRVDKLKFIRVLNNMFKNAIEAMSNGGKITILAEEKNKSIFIKITDTGIGIPKDKIDTLFRPFQTTKSKGIGLGLAFCKNTIEAHGGNISVESKLGKGTTFTISIPSTMADDIQVSDENVVNIKDPFV